MITKKLAVLFSGTGSNFAYILKHLHKQGFEVVLALTNNPKAEGIAFAKAYHIPLAIINSKDYQSREDFDKVLVQKLQEYAPDLTILAGFMRILTPVFTNTIKSINLHPSLLPRHKGLHAIEKSYADEYPSGGISVHWVSSELDGGKIILQKEVSKTGLNFEAYDKALRDAEKPLLIQAIKTVC